MLKTCIKCNEEKDISGFRVHKNKLRADGTNVVSNVCKKCQIAKDSARRKENWDDYLVKARQWSKNNPASRRRSGWKAQGIDPSKAEAYYHSHNGKCDLCGTVENNGKAMSIDHCHTTGVIRGMLCNNCNRGIGLLKDDPQLLMKAAKYVLAVSGSADGGREDIG